MARNKNAKTELFEILEANTKVISDIKWAKFQRDSAAHVVVLTEGWENADMELFLELLNFEYYAGYGGQEVYGLVLFKDNTWLERGEYDGSEWWEYKKQPEITDSIGI